MSFEEEIPLKDLVAQTLESNGSLAKVRAQLRSSIFCVLSEDEQISGAKPLMNNKIRSSLETMEGKIMFCIVREFLQYFGMDFTLSVYESESYFGKIYHNQDRSTIAQELGLESAINEDLHVPLLLELIRHTKSRKNENIQDTRKYVNESEISQDDNSKTNLNTTFDISNPTVNLVINKRKEFGNDVKRCDVDIIEDKTKKENNSGDDLITQNKSLNLDVISQPVLKESRNTDKIKPKSTLNETSTLQNNKSRPSDILPSLYNKEYLDKSGSRDMDKMFDMELEYEEDFMYSSDLPSKFHTNDDTTENCENTCNSNEFSNLDTLNSMGKSKNDDNKCNSVG